MAMWMWYVVATGAALGAAAHFAERALALVGRQVRWAWFVAMLGTVLWPFAAHSAIAGRGTGGAVRSSGAAPSGFDAAGWRVFTADLTGGASEPWLLGSWLAASLVLLVALLLAGVLMRGERRRWAHGVVAGESVLLSVDTGPAVTGAIRPRIVLPARIFEVDEPVQRLIVQHEREHLRAGDSRLLAAALLLLVALPWCVPLWWQLRRLRFAIESDCDERLLRAGASPRAYAEALLTVASWRPAALPLTAMASSKATLERRIRSIVTRRHPRRAVRTLVPLAAAALPLFATAALPAPPPPSASAVMLRHSARSLDSVQPLPDGSLPGDPGAAALEAALAAYHDTAVTTVPAGSIVWFIANSDGTVRRTGIERGTEDEVVARIRARYPVETSDMALAFEGVPVGAGVADVVWLLPPLP